MNIIKWVKEALEAIGVLGTLAVFFFLCSAVVLIGAAALDPGAMAALRANTPLSLAIVLAILSLLLFISALIKHRDPVLENIDNDRVVLKQKILPYLEREAFRNKNSEAEDLRALFSACNQARTSLNQSVNEITSQVIHDIVNFVIDDLRRVSELSPFDKSEYDIKPDAGGDRCKKDRDVVREWYMEISKNGATMLDDYLFTEYADDDPEKRSIYVYGKLQRYIWNRLEPTRAARICLKRVGRQKA